MIERICKSCSRTFPQYNTAQSYCGVCSMNRYSKPRTPIKRRGKKAIAYEKWRDEVAIPYLNDTFGRKCAECSGDRCGNNQLDVDHISSRGSNPSRVFDLTNIQYLGRFPCHYEKTNGIKNNPR